MAIHRLVEQQAAQDGGRPAIVEGTHVLTYGQLNARANAVARDLMARGFHRGGHALVVMERGTELATVLLAVLKAGGCYTWLDPSEGAGYPQGVSITVARAGDQDVYQVIDLPVAQEGPTGPNLPVLIRPSDIAVVLGGNGAGGRIVVPHEAVLAMRDARMSAQYSWERDAQGFDVWLVLIAGGTLTIDAAVADAAA